MSELLLVAVTRGATKGTTPSVFQHLRRHLLSAGDMPSPMDAAAILDADLDWGHFLADGVPIRLHHPARSILPLFLSAGSLANSRECVVRRRGMGTLTEALLGRRVGRSTLSRVTRRLDDEVEALRREPIAEPVTYLYLDTSFVDGRWARSVENVSALVAYGVGPDGFRRLLAVHIGAQESEAGGATLLAELVERVGRRVAATALPPTLGTGGIDPDSLPRPSLATSRRDCKVAPCFSFEIRVVPDRAACPTTCGIVVGLVPCWCWVRPRAPTS